MTVQTQAHDYVSVRHTLRYELLVAKGKRLYNWVAEQREFIEAVLNCDIVRSNTVNVAGQKN